MPIINNLSGNEIEILKLADFLTGVEHDITDVYFGELQVFTVWAETEGTLPLTINANGEPLIDWKIYGNVVQASTPTPSSPVDVSGVGERTAQRYNDATKKTDTSIIWASGAETSREGYELSDYIAVGATETLTTSRNVYFAGYDNNKTYLGTYYPDANAWDKNGRGSTSTFPNSVALGAAYVRILSPRGLSDIMLNTGSTALPYEPFGYKIPITCGGTTTNIYLGTSSSTRRIKKLVLTGTEDWLLHTSYANLFRLNTITDYLFALQNITICNAYEGIINGGAANVGDKQTGFYYTSGASIRMLYIKDTNYSTAADFKAYLAQQYANGAPVTVWYVLATPETAVTNEPLMKIGSYADEITKTSTGVEIPTTNGSNTLTVGTTVQPSEMYVKYRKHGT